MNPELKEKWIAALRSGEYKQTKGRLMRRWKKQNGEGYNYCCLGVLETIAPGDYNYELRSEEMMLYMTQTELGLCSDTAKELARLNDVEEKSFKEIADYIEENL